MMYAMKKEHVLWASVCLLFIHAPAPLHADSNQRFYLGNLSDLILPPPKIINPNCALEADTGPCRGLFIKYFFNTKTHQCEEFVYGGCNGNPNRFDTLEECKVNCTGENPDLCSLEKEPGICRGYIRRYFYNKHKRKCESFIYGGCLGNANNFESLAACQKTCKKTGNENVNAFTSQPIKNSQSSESLLPPLKLVNSFCALKMDSGPCRAMIVRYYFNILTQECEEFLYGGCNGNQNRFETLEECKEKCAGGYHKFTEGIMSKQRPRFCSLSEDPGICRGYIRRYFFNSRSGQCESFIYGGCLGNLNNFDSLELCKKTCKAEASVSQNSPHDKKNDTLTAKPSKVPWGFVYLGPSWCLSKADRGFCLANETRYYYNSYYKRCLPFKYSGCGGNENNFTTKGACIKTCQTGFIKKAKPEGGFIKTKKRKEPVKILFVKVPVTKT